MSAVARVWVHPQGRWFPYKDSITSPDLAPYVPEQVLEVSRAANLASIERAIAAEQERDEHLKWRTVEQEIGDKQRADLAALRAERDALVETLKRCAELFGKIRCDWTDPRAECREGAAIIRAMLAKEGT